MTASSTLSRSRSVPPADQPAPRRRRWLRWLVILALVLLLAAAGWLVGFSTALATRQVTVVGNTTLSVEEVRSAAAVPLGLPLIRQDLSAIADDVDTLEPVRVAEVTRRWPNTIAISVQERAPVLAFRQSNGFRLVDKEGVGYRTVASAPKGVVVTSASLADVQLLTQLGEVAAALSPDLRSKVTLLQAYTSDSIVLTLKSGDTVNWGSSAESDLKVRVLDALLKQPARHYDVSAPRNPSLR